MAGLLYFDGNVVDTSLWTTLGAQPTWQNGGSVKEQTLSWVNQVRHSFGSYPISELPKGSPQNKKECVIAKCFSEFGTVSVEPMLMTISTREKSLPHTIGMYLPQVVAKFISLFDTGRFPELILDQEIPKPSEEKPSEPTPKEKQDISDAKKFMKNLWISPDNGKIFIYPPLPTNKAGTELISAAYS